MNTAAAVPTPTPVPSRFTQPPLPSAPTALTPARPLAAPPHPISGPSCAAVHFAPATRHRLNEAAHSYPSRWRRGAARAFLLSSALLALSACSVFQPQPDPVRYFTLGEPTGEASGASVFRLMPISLAGHLRSRALAIRVGEHEIVYDETVRWTEPLDEVITLALRAQLASRSRMQLREESSTNPSPRLVNVRIDRFELVRQSPSERGGQIELTAEWSLDGLPRAAFRAPPRDWDGRDVKELIALMREALDELAISCPAELQSALN